MSPVCLIFIAGFRTGNLFFLFKKKMVKKIHKKFTVFLECDPIVFCYPTMGRIKIPGALIYQSDVQVPPSTSDIGVSP